MEQKETPISSKATPPPWKKKAINLHYKKRNHPIAIIHNSTSSQRTYEERTAIEKSYILTILELKSLGNKISSSPKKQYLLPSSTCYNMAKELDQVRKNRHLDLTASPNGERRIHVELYYNVAKSLPSVLESICHSNFSGLACSFAHISSLIQKTYFQLRLRDEKDACLLAKKDISSNTLQKSEEER